MAERLSPSGLIQSGINGLCTVANLDPRDPRTKNFKRAVAVNIGQENPKAENHANTLSRLTGHKSIDWETKFTESLPADLQEVTGKAIASSLEVTDRDPILATVHAVGTFIKPMLDTVEKDQADEVIRQLVTGIAASK